MKKRLTTRVTVRAFCYPWMTWATSIAPRDISAAQTAYWEDVMRKVMHSSEFKAVAERNQWDVDFKGAAETRKHFDEEYAATKKVMAYLGLIP